MPNTIHPPPQLQWTNLWPASVPAQVQGWTAHLPPGLHALVDHTGDDAAHWLAVLSGQEAPASGQVQCMGLCSVLHRANFQQLVYWHHPRAQDDSDGLTAVQWVHRAASAWPTWSDAAWLRHRQGWDLAVHMDKPLIHLSTGCRRKLGLAVALASGASITLIEEPTAGLDSASVRYLQGALDSMGRALSASGQAQRWIMVAHWEPMAGVTWHEVLQVPALQD